MALRIAILGWGSLIWDKRPEFDDRHEAWQLGAGPEIKLETTAAICEWSKAEGLDAVVWTDLDSNFEEQCHEQFSVDAALRYIQRWLDPEGKSKAAEYVWRAPDFVTTPLRAALQTAPWFAPSPNTSK